MLSIGVGWFGREGVNERCVKYLLDRCVECLSVAAQCVYGACFLVAWSEEETAIESGMDLRRASLGSSLSDELLVGDSELSYSTF